MTHPAQALPLVKKAHKKAAGQAKLQYAQLLGVYGEKYVVPELIAALQPMEWDPKILQGKMADFAHLPTPVDSVILALGHTGDRSATPAILRLLKTLDAEVTLSHHRSVALALEELADPKAAKPLADLLAKPGMQGHALTKLPKKGDFEERIGSLREIALARALYKCGDHKGIGKKILHEYTNDHRGLFARHAKAVLNEK